MVRVRDEAQAHVGCGVMEVANKIHRLGTSFRTQQSVQFSGSDQLIGGLVWYGTTGRWRNNLEHNSSWSVNEHHHLHNAALLEGGVGEAAVQVGVDVSAALLCGPRVRQYHQHWQRLFLLLLHHFLVRLQQLSHQVHSRQLISMGTTAHCDPGQPWQTHHLVYLHLTESRQRYSARNWRCMQEKNVLVCIYNCILRIQQLISVSLSGRYQLPHCWCHWVHCWQHCNTKQRNWFVKPYLVFFLACWKL